jgi:nucleoid DNA-binding protein
MVARKMSAKQIEKALDAEISALYRVVGDRIQIDIMDIGKVFKVAKAARAEGRDMKEAMVAFLAVIRKN